MHFVWFILLNLLLASAVFAADISGPVVSVLDGDTIEVLNGHHAERIRLSGIDCPEKGQAYSKRAKQAASALAFRKQVTIQAHGYDKYKRTIADVTLPDGMNLNQELVKQGWCWWYRKYAPDDTVLQRLESEAREAKKGLWADPAPIPPWVNRKARQRQSFKLSDVVPLETENEGKVAVRSPPLLSTGTSNAVPIHPTSLYPIIGNRKSHIYHRPDCPNYSEIAPKNRRAFNSAADAQRAGYRVAGNCP